MELFTVELPRDTRRRLEIFGFNQGLSGRDVVVFLLEQGLAVLEKRFPPERKAA
jgi:hypothetical protein